MKGAATFLLLVVLVLVAAASCQYLDQPDQRRRGPQEGRLVVVDKSGEKKVNLSPGLLEQSLLKRGSFDFSQPQVKFDKLKVLGNIYVHRINGHKLRDHYLLKSSPVVARTSQHQLQQQPGQQQQSKVKN